MVKDTVKEAMACDEYNEMLREWLATRERREVSSEGCRPAAVLLLLLEKDGSCHILVTKRSHLVSTHKGDMSLPGGGVEENDRSIFNTALRETHEETGVAPESVEILGLYDDYLSISGHHVSVVVGVLKESVDYSFNDEIDDYVEVPLKLFIEEKYDRMEEREFQGRSYEIYFYDLPQGTIWGLTGRLLTDFGRDYSLLLLE